MYWLLRKPQIWVTWFENTNQFTLFKLIVLKHLTFQECKKPKETKLERVSDLFCL